MSSEVAVPDAVAVGDVPENSLVVWAQEARQAHQIAVSLAETSFVPKAMQHKPEEVTGAILAGRELGLSPMAALRSIDIIDGTPAMRAHGLRGLVQSHGHEIWVEESTESRAIVCGRRRSSPLGRQANIERSTWTMDRAKRAGLAGKRNWQTYPGAMLIARATAEVCRLIAADVLLGMPYAVEELDGGGDPRLAGVAREVEPAKKAASKPRTLQRRPALATAAAAAAPAEEEPEPEDTDEPAATPAQRKALFAAFRAIGMVDRAARLRRASAMLGRTVSSFTDLTVVDAGRLLDGLESPAGEPDEPDDDDAGHGDDWPPVPEPGSGGWA